MAPAPSPSPGLRRRLGLFDATVVGLGSMIGAGVFAALAPAARAAGSALLLGLLVAAAVAYCNAMSSARLAALYPASGGTYVYGSRRLGPFWGYLAGWSFVVGKTASCAAIALTFASYVAPARARVVAVAAVAALTGISYLGVQKSAWLTRLIVAVVLVSLALVVTACLAGGRTDAGRLGPFAGAGVHGTLQAAGLLFFAFAGYARIATLGEEVRDPARTIPRAIALALAIVLVVYAVIAVAALSVVGASGLAATSAPLRLAVDAGSLHSLLPAVQVGAVAATFGSLLALLLGVSRTVLAMARDRRLPRFLASVHPRFGSPHRAELAVGLVVSVLIVLVDLRGAIGFSSFGVLIYYAIANASALTLRAGERPLPRGLPLLGLGGCVLLAASLPLRSVVSGIVVLALGVVAWALRPGHRPVA